MGLNKKTDTASSINGNSSRFGDGSTQSTSSHKKSEFEVWLVNRIDILENVLKIKTEELENKLIKKSEGDIKTMLKSSDFEKKIDAKLSREVVDRVNIVMQGMWGNIIAMFAIFASVTTFILGEVQVYRVYCDPLQIVGMSLIFAATMVLFVFLILYFYKASDRIDNSQGYFVAVFLLIVMIGSLSFSVGSIGLFGYNRAVCSYDNGANILINNSTGVN